MMAKIKNYYKNLRRMNICIENINLNLITNQKRVLYVYLENQFLGYDSDKVFATNILESSIILKNFIEKDYVVDVINFDDLISFKKLSNKKYDLIFGLGKVYLEACKKNLSAKKVLYLTENFPEKSYELEMERVNYYKARKNKKIKLSRSLKYYTQEHIDISDVFIKTDVPKKDEYIGDKRLYFISPTGLKNNNVEFVSKDHMKTRNEFLWFGSNGAIHKGLDILVDIFEKRDDITLHICGISKKDKRKIKLPKKSNIINHGKISVGSDKYLKLVKSVSYMILPSCSEGRSTSVLTSMRHGLIPIICRYNGFKSNEAIILEDYKVEYIEKIINELMKKPVEWLEKEEKRYFDLANENATLEAFYVNFKEILAKL